MRMANQCFSHSDKTSGDVLHLLISRLEAAIAILWLLVLLLKACQKLRGCWGIYPPVRSWARSPPFVGIEQASWCWTLWRQRSFGLANFTRQTPIALSIHTYSIWFCEELLWTQQEAFACRLRNLSLSFQVAQQWAILSSAVGILHSDIDAIKKNGYTLLPLKASTSNWQLSKGNSLKQWTGHSSRRFERWCWAYTVNVLRVLWYFWRFGQSGLSIKDDLPANYSCVYR